MKRKKFLAFGSIVVAMVAAAGSYHAYSSYSVAEECDLLMANVEALSQILEDPKPLTYSSIHTPCYITVKYGETYVTRPSGEYNATCFENPNSQKETCHSHACSPCSSD